VQIESKVRVLFQVLGGVRATVGGVDLGLSGQPQRLVGVLLAERDRVVTTDLLVERLWADRPPATAPKVVHVLVGKLRRALEPDLIRASDARVICKAPRGYRLVAGPTDLDRFLELAESASQTRSRRPRQALAHAWEALDVWTGRPWGTQADEAWLVDRVAALEETHRRIEELWADLMLLEGRGGEAIERFRAAALAEPLRERRWAQLATALYASDRQAEALRELDRARQLLRDELGLGLSEELARLELAILHHDPSLSATPARAVVVTGTSFVGREEDLVRLSHAIERERLVTVVGLGGVGKTRLVDEHAHRRRLSGERTWKVTFAEVDRATSVGQQVCDQLGWLVDDPSTADQTVAAAIGSGPGLLVLDGAEHVADEVGVFVLRLLDACPQVHVVATARVPLGVGAERTVALSPLPVPSADQPSEGTALELLIDRSGLDIEFIDTDTLVSLRDACAATAGVPMLIELTSRVLEVTDLTRDAAPAVRSESHAAAVNDAISTSMELVDDSTRELLFDAAVLAGGVCDATAATLLAADTTVARRALRQLAWLHLVEADAGISSLRYCSLDPIRHALLERRSTAQREVSIRRAAEALERVLEALKPCRAEPIVTSQLDGVADELENLRQVIANRREADPVRALELSIRASEFWSVRGLSTEGSAHLVDSIEAVQPTGELRWRAVAALVRMTRTMADTASLRPELEAVLDEMRGHDVDLLLRGVVLMHLAIARGWQGDRAGAGAALDEAEMLNREVGTRWSTAHLDHLRGLDDALSGDFVAARNSQRAFVRVMLELDDPASAATGAYLAAAMGDMAGREDVRDDIEQARTLAGIVKDPIILGQLLLLEARVLTRTRDERARSTLETAIDDLESKGVLRPAALARRDLGLLELSEGRRDRAREHLNVSLPVLLKLDRSASALACGGLAVLAQEDGRDEPARRRAAAARPQLRPDTPTSAEDRERLAALVPSATTRPAVDDLDDAEILDWCADASR
jgi:DNA-binding SARP family transcriptional activator/predicted ATPase